jgi:membrane-associated phospholipid phosphatase
VVLFYATKKKMKQWIKMFFMLFMLGIWFSAVYSGHHYIIDVVLGVMLALMTLFLFDRILRNPQADKMIRQFVERI